MECSFKDKVVTYRHNGFTQYTHNGLAYNYLHQLLLRKAIIDSNDTFYPNEGKINQLYCLIINFKSIKKYIWKQFIKHYASHTLNSKEKLL